MALTRHLSFPHNQTLFFRENSINRGVPRSDYDHHHLFLYVEKVFGRGKMDIVHKMRVHASVDGLCVDDVTSPNIHGMHRFATEACRSIKKDAIDDCAEHVARRCKHDSPNVRTKALKLITVLAREGPEEMKQCLSKRAAKILRDVVTDNGENFGRKTFEGAKEAMESLFGNSTSASSSATTTTTSSKIVGISGQQQQNQQRKSGNVVGRGGGGGGANVSLTGLEAASGLLRTAGGTAMNVAGKIGAHVNEITKEREKHRTNVDETYYKSEMTGGSLADAMRGVGGGGSGGGMSGPWGRSEEEEEVVAKAAERKVEQTPSPPPPPPPTTTSSSDPLGDFFGIATNSSAIPSTTHQEEQIDLKVKTQQKAEWTLKGTGPTRAVLQSPPPTLIPLEGSEEQKRVDSLCGVAGVKLVPDEAELTQLFEHVDRKGLEASLIVRALLDKVALAYDSELMDAQSGWKCAKKALGCISKALSWRDSSVLETALKADENLKLTLRKTIEMEGVKDTVKKSSSEILKQLDDLDASFFGTTTTTTPPPPPTSFSQSGGLDASLFTVDAANDSNDAFFSSAAAGTTTSSTTTTHYNAPKAPMTGPGLVALAELDAQQQQKDGTKQQDVAKATKAFASLKW